MLDDAINAGVAETDQLDGMRALPAEGDMAKSDVPEDIPAFANSGGGVIVYGVTEEQARATGEWSPFSSILAGPGLDRCLSCRGQGMVTGGPPGRSWGMNGLGEGIFMGYGFGGFLLVVGLVLALAVQDTLSGVDLTAVGWIMALVGLVLIVLTAVTWNRSRGAESVATTTHSDGTQTVSQRRTQI